MYFSEQGNVDDDATLITIFLVSFNLQSCCLMESAVCSLQMSYTDSSDTATLLYLYELQLTISSSR